jgi:hypothetical protein
MTTTATSKAMVGEVRSPPLSYLLSTTGGDEDDDRQGDKEGNGQGEKEGNGNGG